MATKSMDELIDERRALAIESDSDGAFPGSKAWKTAREAEKRLKAFDAEHPEVLAKVQADHAAEMAGRYQD